jgi:tetratricopeptide (TPR) repeat protein
MTAVMLSILLGALSLAATSPIEEALTGGDVRSAAGAAVQALEQARQADDDGSSVDHVLGTLLSSSRHPLVRDLARRVRLQERMDAGLLALAGADADALGSPREIRCVGPFANTGGRALGEPTSADDVDATISMPLMGLDRPVRWTLVDREPRGGFDVGGRFVAGTEVRARCAVTVTMKRGTIAALRIASSGPIMVWQGSDRRLVLSHDEDHVAGFDQDAALVALPRGRTMLVFELSMLGSGGILDLRLTAPDGSRIDGVTWSATERDMVAAATVPAPPMPAGVPQLVSLTFDDAALGRPGTTEARSVVSLLRHGRGFDVRARPTALTRTIQTWVDAATGDDRALALAALAADALPIDPSKALQHLTEAMKLATTPSATASVGAGMAKLREHQGDPIAASVLWRQAVALAPERMDLVTESLAFERRRGVLGSIVDREIIERSRTSRHRALLELAADVLDDRGDLDGALALARRSGNAERTAVREASLLDARLAVDPSALPHLLALLGTRLSLSPRSHGVAERLALLLRDSGALDQAEAVVAERQRRYPERPEPWRLAATMALLGNDRPRAVSHLQTAHHLTPDDGDLQRTLRALQDAGDDLVDRLLPPFGPVDIEAARAPPPKDASSTGAFIHRKAIATRFFDNGNLQHVEDIVIVIVDARKAPQLRAWSWGYSGGREQLEVLAAERIGLDGRREAPQRITDQGQDGKENGAYSDARTKTALFANVVDGDVLHLRIRRETVGLQNLFGDFFGALEVLQGPLPVRHFQMVIEGPSTRPLFVGGRGGPPAVITTDGDVTRHTFVDKDLDALIGETGMPPWLELARYISVSTYGDWGALGRWYEALIADQLHLNDELRQLVRDLKAEAKDEQDLVRRIYEHVVTSTRYVGIELGIHGWKPYPVAEVYRRRFGDCKDKASLLVALLREAGIEAHVALVRTIQLGNAAADPPSMWAFNHAIAWVKPLNLFLDGTAERSGLLEIPPMDQGALALIVDGTSTRLVTIPVAPADDNINTSLYTLRLQTDGSLVVTGEERFHGSHNSRERQRFEDNASQRQTLERDLASSIPGTQVTKIDVMDLSLGAIEVGYRFEAILPKRAVVDNDGSLVMPLSLYPHDLTGNYAETSSRRFELFVDHPWRTRNVMHYVLPPGMRVQDLPRGGRVENAHIRFIQTVVPTADGFTVDEDTALLSRRIPMTDYAAFRDAAITADRFMKRKIRIIPVGDSP